MSTYTSSFLVREHTPQKAHSVRDVVCKSEMMTFSFLHLLHRNLYFTFELKDTEDMGDRTIVGRDVGEEIPDQERSCN